MSQHHLTPDERLLAELDLASLAPLRRMEMTSDPTERARLANESIACSLRGIFAMLADRQELGTLLRSDSDCKCATCVHVREQAERENRLASDDLLSRKPGEKGLCHHANPSDVPIDGDR